MPQEQLHNLLQAVAGPPTDLFPTPTASPSMNASTSLVTTDMMDFDQQLAQLLGGMTLQNTWNVVPDVAPHDASAPHTPPAAQDAFMSDSSDTEDAAYPARCPSPLFFSAPLLTFDDLDAHFGGAGSKGRPRRGGSERKRAGGVHALTSGRFPTTGGEYLEAIFTHREVSSAFPQGHRECAIAFSSLASSLESRAPRADRDGDAEAVAAFRHEAWVIANMAGW